MELVYNKNCRLLVDHGSNDINMFKAINCELVAVHIRRGDFAIASARKVGLMPADADYLRRAIKHFREKLVGSCTRYIHT